MHGRPAGGYRTDRPYTPAEKAEQARLDARARAEERALPHAHCRKHPTACDSPGFAVRYGCPTAGCTEADWVLDEE